jgi:type VI secretion system protein ImpB
MAVRPTRRAKPGKERPRRPDQRRDLPFVIGVLADLAGQAPVDPSRPPALVAVSHDSLDDFMASLSPVLAFRVADTLKGEGELAIELHFRSLQDFRPDRLLQQVPRLHRLHETRTGLVALRALLVRDPEADVPEDLVAFDPRTRPGPAAARPVPPVEPRPAAADPPRMRLAAGAFQTQASADGVWSSRVPKPRPPDPAAEPPERSGIAAQLLADAEAVVAAEEIRAADRAREDPVAEIDRRVDAIDDVLSEQLDALCQAPALRTLEASWRGLDLLLRSTRPCPRVQVRVMALRRADLPQQLAAHDAAPSLHVPRSDVDDAPLPAPDWLSMLAACRVAQQLRGLIQARPGPFAGPEACAAAVQAWLQPWLAPDGLAGLEVDRGLLDQAVATVQADGQAGWRLWLALTPARVRSRGGPVLLTVALPADRILATENPAVPLPDAPAEAGLQLQAQASGAGSGRTRFLARRLLAERALAAGQLDVARVVLDELAEQIERHRLPDWEDPQVVVPVWRLLRRVLLAADRPTPADGAPDLLRAQQLLRLICALDPAAALEEGH